MSQLMLQIAISGGCRFSRGFLPKYRNLGIFRAYSAAVAAGSDGNGSWKTFTLNDELNVDVKKAIETKWHSKVYGTRPISEYYKADNGKCNKSIPSYILSMFPYPSGKLHLGHVRVYTLSDVLARYHRLRNENVMHPMGWDAFGLPAENAARDHGIEPGKWTRDNISYMKEQIIRMGCVFDWDREFATCDPEYYKWTQWLFFKLVENGLAYKKRAFVYWDPIDQTVLAEEQVDSEMKSWRSGATVEKKLLSQWFIKTATFAKELKDCLDSDALKHGWRDIIDLQKHWIGDLYGYFADCPILSNCSSNSKEFLRVWFSNPEAFARSKFLILQPNNYLLKFPENIINSFDNGIVQLNCFIRNPATGKTMPVFASLTGQSPHIPESSDCRVDEILDVEIFGDLIVNEDQLLEYRRCSKDAIDYDTSNLPSQSSQFIYHPASLKLRDWLVSRQRNWGTPIPSYDCLDCGASSPVPANLLPVPNKPTIEYPVCHNQNTIGNVTCPSCGSRNIKSESDTLDTFFDSSWYYLRYLDPKNGTAIFNPNEVEPWLPVRAYIGGKEHATLHLYYSRFMSHFLHKLGLIHVKEPFKILIPVGVVMGETYIVKGGKYVTKDVVEMSDCKKLVEKGTGLSVTKKWEKMSKSKYNGIDPDLVLDEFGIDSMRLLTMSDIAPTSVRKWTPLNFNAFLKFQNKVWLSVRDFVNSKEDDEHLLNIFDDEAWQKVEDEIFDVRNYYLKHITHNYEETHQISVAVSRLQGLIAALRKIPKSNQRDSLQFERALGTLLIAMYPIMPAFSAQLWQYFRDVADLSSSEFDLDNEIWCQKWPEVDENYKLELIVKVSNIEIDTVKVERNILDTIDQRVALEFALESTKVQELCTDPDVVSVRSLYIYPGFRAIINLRPTKTTSKDNEETEGKLEEETEAIIEEASFKK